MSYVDCCQSQCEHVCIVQTHSMNAYDHKNSENQKTPLRHKTIIFFLHKSPLLLSVPWSRLRGIDKAFAHSAGFFMNAEVKVYFLGCNVPDKCCYEMAYMQQPHLYHFSTQVVTAVKSLQTFLQGWGERNSDKRCKPKQLLISSHSEEIQRYNHPPPQKHHYSYPSSPSICLYWHFSGHVVMLHYLRSNSFQDGIKRD